MKLLIDIQTKKQWLIIDEHKDFYTQYGKVSKEHLQQTSFVNEKQRAFCCITPSIHDAIIHLQRGAQVILPKDAGYILAHCGITKTHTIVDAGAGSGWLTCYLAHYAKKVYSCDINEKHLALVHKNVERLGLRNVVIKHHDIYSGLPATPDILTLDVPEPWQVFSHTKKMRIGSFCVCYTPHITQAQQCVIQAQEHGFSVVHTTELIERTWLLGERKARPLKDEIGHTGFITILRKLFDPIV
ncbi:MAG: tRNA (adenine-N1)-methyltransferase [Candidatus Woesearchaeota archaeon]